MRLLMRLLAITVALAGLDYHGAVYSQTSSKPKAAAPLATPNTSPEPSAASNSDTNGEIELTAEQGVDWLRVEKKYIARGQAIAKRGTLELHASEIMASYKDDGGTQIMTRLDASGNVKILDQGTEAQGERGIYHIDKKLAVLFGHNLKITNQARVITAEDTLEYWQEKQIAVARGHARALSEDKRLQADNIVAYLGESAKANKNMGKNKSNPPSDKSGANSSSLEIKRIEAIGGVKLATAQEIITGKEGRYDVMAQQMIICGDVQITRGENHLQGECATTDMNTGISRIDGGKNGRVRGLILPTR